MLLSLILLGFGSLTIPVLLNFGASAVKQGTSEEDRTTRSYVADAGTESAIWWVRYANHDTDPLPSTVGSYKVLPLVTEASITAIT